MFSKICGKTISVKSFNVDVVDAMTVKLICSAEDKDLHSVVFKNVSSLKLENISFPFEISALEILDYTNRGYQMDKRFFVNDYEEGKISFFCEEVEIDKNKR